MMRWMDHGWMGFDLLSNDDRGGWEKQSLRLLNLHGLGQHPSLLKQKIKRHFALVESMETNELLSHPITYFTYLRWG